MHKRVFLCRLRASEKSEKGHEGRIKRTYGEFALGTQPNFADYYNQTVRLLDANFVEITSNSQNPTLTDQWQWIGGSFSSYGPGLRYIKYEHSGMDVEFFLGHYGSTMDYALVQLGASTTSVADVADKQFNFDWK